MIFNVLTFSILENDWALENGIWFNMMEILLENEVVKIVTWREEDQRFCQMYTLENEWEGKTNSNQKIDKNTSKSFL
jgi:hypothetical protein